MKTIRVARMELINGEPVTVMFANSLHFGIRKNHKKEWILIGASGVIFINEVHTVYAKLEKQYKKLKLQEQGVQE